MGDVLTAAEMDQDQVRELWQQLTGLSVESQPEAWDTCEDAILGAIDPLRGLQMRPGGWTIDLRQTAVRTALAAALIAGAMWPAGFDQLPAFVLPQVLPLLFDVERAKLSRKEKQLLIELRLTTTAAQMPWPWTPAALLARLPLSVQQTVSPEDFADFVDQLVRIGEADDAGFGEVRLRPSAKPAWLRITVR